MESIYNNNKLFIGLSGGINSMDLLCWLKEQNIQCSELHLYYAHFKEHSPDTFKFVKAGIRFARQYFKNVIVTVTRNSVLEYFEKQNLIPHPTNGACSKWLKIIPMQEYCFRNNIKYDLVGYVKHELKRRTERQLKHIQISLFDAEKVYTIGDFTDEWCFEIVLKHLGWYPAIYDIKDSKGKRIFKHNNCLPCKNMRTKDMEAVKIYYPTYHANAMVLSNKLKKYWGRNKDEFYLTFGRDLGQDSSCAICKF